MSLAERHYMSSKTSSTKNKSRGKKPRTKSATPPPNSSIIALAGGQQHPTPNLWNFNHTHPQIPGILNCVVRAPNITEARAVAYLLAENFAANAIGFIKAGLPPPLRPPRFKTPMPSTISTFNALHLGDNLIHLHFLRKLAQKYSDVHFTHGAPDQHLAQLYPLWQDIPNLTVQSIAATGQGAINAWRGAGGWYYQQPDQYDFLQIHLRWFRHLAEMMGLESPIQCAADMLFDYPALKNNSAANSESWDFLVVNSAPQSGQWQGFTWRGFDDLVATLRRAGKSVITTCPGEDAEVPSTMDVKGDVTHIGKVAQISKCIIGCVTGPLWPTLNIWNRQTVALRIHLLDHERVDLAPNTVHANSLSLVPELLKDRGLL